MIIPNKTLSQEENTLHCDFLVDCVCKKKISFEEHPTKFKLTRCLVDNKIKEDILEAEDKSLEDTVKALETNECIKHAKVKLGG